MVDIVSNLGVIGYSSGIGKAGGNRMKVWMETWACPPERAHEGDAGLDLRAAFAKTVKAGGSAIFDTGVHVDIPEGCCGLLVSKSGLNVKHGITSTGLVDSGYKGSVLVKLYNHTGDDYEVQAGDKITQMLVLPYRKVSLELVGEDEFMGRGSERGEGGFGSSGR